jgi:cytochrome c5
MPHWAVFSTTGSTMSPAVCRIALLSSLAAGLTLAPNGPATAQPASGEALYQSACSACHRSGNMGAPRIGDGAAWKPLLRQGQVQLTAQGWVGIRRMPPRGNADDASLEQFARAVVHLARAGGADWSDPTPELMTRIEREVARLEASAGKK